MADIESPAKEPVLGTQVAIDHREDVARALAHLRRAASIVDRAVAEDATRLSAAPVPCHGIVEASQAIHRAVLAAEECVDGGH